MGTHAYKNRPWLVAALELTEQTAGQCPIPSGMVGLWNDAGVIKWRQADGTDTVTGGATGVNVFTAHAVCTSALAANTYANGTAGVGATLTGNANGAFATIDGVAAAANNYYLVTAETAAYNGLYKLTTLGTGSVPFVLTRAEEFDEAAEMLDGVMFQVLGGTTNADTLWKNTANVTTVGTTAVTITRDPLTVTTNTAQTISAVKTFSAAPAFTAEANYSIAVGASSTSNTAGGNLGHVAGAGVGSGNGGTYSIAGGAAGATGTGGTLTVTGGAGGSASGAGGAVTVAGGNGTAGNGNGGALAIRGGNAHGVGTDGAVSIGDSNTSSVELAVTGITTNVNGPLVCDEAVNLNGTSTTIGDAATDELTLTAVLATNLSMKKEVNHTISVVTSTTADTAGGNLTIGPGAGFGTGAGGTLALTGAQGGATGQGSPVTLTGGAGGATGGAGGAITIEGGAAQNGGANGGALTIRGGAKHGGGTDGTLTIGATNTSAIGIGASGITTTLSGPLALAANIGVSASAGTGALTLGSMTGDTTLPTGSTSWAGASGKTLTITSTAGAITITSATSGTVRLDGAGAVQIANSASTSLAIGTSGTIATWGAKQAAGATTNNIADPGNAGAIPVTASGVCNITSAGAGHTRTVALPTFEGQTLLLAHDADGGDVAVTFASGFNVAGNTVWTTDTVGEYGMWVARRQANTLKWAIVANDGGALS